LNHENIRNDVLKASDVLFHFFSKWTNTNAKIVSIRVGRKDGLRLPYVSARCIIGRGGMVYLGAKNKAVSAAGFSDVMIPNANHREFIPTKNKMEAPVFLNRFERALLRGVHDREKTEVIEDEGIDVRMRQILLPDGSGSYVAIVPMQSLSMAHMVVEKSRNIAGITESQTEEDDEDASDDETDEDSSAVESEAVQDETDEPGNSADSIYRKLMTVDYPVGGAKPQNAGIQMGGKDRRFIVVGFYRSNADASIRASAMHRGVANRLSMDEDTIEKYANFTEKCRWSVHEWVAHKGYVKRIVNHYLDQAARMAQTMSAEDLESMESDLDKGLVDESMRSPAWKKQFAHWVFHRMQSFPIRKKDGEPQYLFGIDRRYLQKLILEVVS